MFAFTNSWRCLHLEFQSLKTDSSCQNVQRYEATAPDHTSCSTGAAGTLLSQHCGEPCIWKRMCKVKQSNMAMRSSYSRCSSLSSRRVMAAECWGYHWNSSVLGHKVKFTHLRYSLSIKICPFLPIGPIRPLLQSSMIIEFHEVLGFWDFYGILGFKVKMHHFEQPASRRVVRKSVECCDFCWISGPQVQLAFQRNWNSRKQSETVGSGPAWSCQNCQSAIFLPKKTFRTIPFFFGSATGNSWKQLGLVPLTRQKKSYLKPFKVHFLYKLVLNSSFFAESKVRAPTVSNCFPLHFQKKKGDCAERFFFCKKMADWQFWHDHAGPLPTVSDCFRLFPAVSDCFRLFQFLWNASWTCGPLIQQKSQHSTLFLTTLLLAGCSKWCILTLKPNIP